MPRTRTLAWSQLKIGILAVAAFVLATMLIFAVGGDAGIFSGKFHLKTRFPNAGGLASGSVVRLAGVNVGAVDDVYFDGAVVEVVLRIRPEVANKITDRSVAQIGSVSLLGEGAVDISASSEGVPLKDWAYIRSSKTPGQIADVAENATQTLAQATALIEDIRAGKGTVGKLFTQDELYLQLNAVVKATDDVVSAIKNGKGPAGTLISNQAAAKNLERALANLDQVTTGIAEGRGTLGTLLKDDALARSLTSTTENLRAVTAGLKNGEGTAGKLLTDNALYNRLDSVVNRLDALVTSLNKGEGTAGKLLQDKQLYDNMNGAVSELRGLLAEIKKDPKKYLNVKVSIF
ncbi:ABC transporter substrate-binding protein [Luteitalea sp. TBR-22]|uniref:MlaD family protein n=1 Tax=Luteitalea sp. TBR-22 TaxID=2802971 RepID=UPI001AF7022F|nr:MlaD family protein [Luteitalea sp. TBR-22]BCS33068.1 ABC transporter substrate-binding protein [Luteitalea sp. TBR-22]